jgi:hypothetical protein
MREPIDNYIQTLRRCAAIGESVDNLITCLMEAKNTGDHSQIAENVRAVLVDPSVYCIEQHREGFYQTLDLLVRDLAGDSN